MFHIQKDNYYYSPNHNWKNQVFPNAPFRLYIIHSFLFLLPYNDLGMNSSQRLVR